MTQLRRLVVEFRGSELVLRCLYRGSLDGPNPTTKARAREVSELTRQGLRQALASLESEADASLVGCSGFVQREDILLTNLGTREEGSAA
jgi:hypothetical protein